MKLLVPGDRRYKKEEESTFAVLVASPNSAGLSPG